MQVININKELKKFKQTCESVHYGFDLNGELLFRDVKELIINSRLELLDKIKWYLFDTEKFNNEELINFRNKFTNYIVDKRS